MYVLVDGDGDDMLQHYALFYVLGRVLGIINCVKLSLQTCPLCHQNIRTIFI